MKEFNVEGIIYVLDDLNIKYAVCYIQQIHYEDETFKYTFKPYYNIIDMLSPRFFQGIPGLNLDLRKDVYIRKNKTPTFIYERTPQENREDLWELLDEVNLNYLDKLEWLIRTDRTYTGDRLIVDRFREPQIKNDYKDIVYKDEITINTIHDLGHSTFDITHCLLEIISHGADLKSADFEINDENRSNIYHLIYSLFRIEYEKKQKEINKKYQLKGRRRINVSLPKLSEVVEKMETKEITAKEAMKMLGINSRSTLYRRIKEFKNNN